MSERGSITYVGHATVSIEIDGVHLLTDPLLRRRMFHLRRQVDPVESWRLAPDAILVSHQHFDHLDLHSLRRLGKSIRIIAPPTAAAFLGRKGFSGVEPLAVGESSRIGPLAVTAVDAEHEGGRHPFAKDGEAVGYVVCGSSRVYFAGDTDLFPGMEDLAGDLDVALVPVWGWGHTLGPGHLDPASAAAAVELLEPRIAIPIHWGTFFPFGLARWGRRHLTDPPHQFASQVAERSPEVEVRLLDPGETTALS
ncbi:MAG: MBL fold metallo-hydrolase [Solirubrobacterales bacterium]|nr:MBL fold metallo-hydrolase [Solirubrobacterales bacterium]